MPRPVTDPALLQQLEGGGRSPVSDPALLAQLDEGAPSDPIGTLKSAGAGALDFVKSIPRGLVKGLTSAPNPSMVPMGDEEAAIAPTRQRAQQTLEAATPEPQGMAGQFGQTLGEGLGNPVNYLGPGGPALKVMGAGLSSLGSEAGKQAAKDTPYEGAASVGGALLGGIAAAKTAGPKAPTAATPTYRELKNKSDELYEGARSSGVEFHPKGMSLFGTQVEQELSGHKHGFVGGADGNAPKTFAALQRLQNPPTDASISASNVDALRKFLGDLSRETKDFKPTADSAAATIALRRLNSYLEDPPPGHVVAGDAQQYISLTKEANANYAAGQRLKGWETRLDNADLDAQGQIAGSLENRQKIAARNVLKSPKLSRGHNEAETDQLKLINNGTLGSNFLRNAGRAGAGVVPAMGQLAAAGPVFAAGGPVGLALQGSLAAGLYGARKGSEAITNKRSNKLLEMLGQRSPLYEQRKAGLPAPDTDAGKAAIIRALLNSQ
jgi:hypothetical protein